MDEREVRPSPVVQPTGPWMIPSDQMVIRRYKPLRYFDFVFRDGFRAGQAAGYPDKQEGRASKAARRREQASGGLNGIKKLRGGGEPDIIKAFEESRKAARHYYYPNCWRLGTSESRDIWNEYADLDESDRAGVAIDSTVGQLKQYLEPDEQLDMGAVRYQIREWEPTPGGFPWFALYFYKGREYDEEQEFRALANQGGNPIMFIDGREHTKEMLPDNPPAICLDADYENLINRVLVAPESDDLIKNAAEAVLQKHDVSVPVYRSQLNSNEAPPWDYESELVGPSNYGYNEDFLELAAERWVSSTDWSDWQTADVVQLNQKDNIHVRNTFIELYRYPNSGPDLDSSLPYGQDHLEYQVRLWRYQDGSLVCQKQNEYATQFEKSRST